MKKVIFIDLGDAGKFEHYVVATVLREAEKSHYIAVIKDKYRIKLVYNGHWQIVEVRRHDFVDITNEITVYAIQVFKAEPWLRQKIHEALGAASMCWSERPKGVFQENRATDIASDLLDDIAELFPELKSQIG